MSLGDTFSRVNAALKTKPMQEFSSEAEQRDSVESAGSQEAVSTQAGQTGTSPENMMVESSHQPSRKIAHSEDLLSEGNVVSEKIADAKTFRGSLLLEQLGIPGGKQMRIIQLDTSDIVPLNYKDVEDTQGRISGIIRKYENSYKIPTVPVEITAIPSWVHPRDHERITALGRQFFCPRDRGDNSEVEMFVSDCIEALQQGQMVFRSVFREFEFEGRVVKTLGYSTKEIVEICGQLKHYGAKLVEIPGVDLKIVAGDFIYE